MESTDLWAIRKGYKYATRIPIDSDVCPRYLLDIYAVDNNNSFETFPNTILLKRQTVGVYYEELFNNKDSVAISSDVSLTNSNPQQIIIFNNGVVNAAP